ncbi:ABC transporter ATP-binding protein [Actinoplanes sp. CA-030573]|uniref:ABC transporter ATP-binding protein n=1 Tax=Actinoplanes sp. CA-030573 TaxID=3239898 RepID=UPI003D8A21D2
MDDIAIAAHDVRCRYGSFEAVGGVDLAVRRGELLCLAGTNGAAKTTIVDTLCGHRRPSGGRVRLLGLDPARHRHRLAARVGVVPQDPGFAGGLTTQETYALWTRLRGHRPERGLADTDLAHRGRVPVRQLSGGERRRLDLAIALAGQPPVLLLDEPTAGLDPEARERAWALIRDRRAAGAAVLLTTHATDEAEALADRYVVMHAGTVAAAGTAAEITAGLAHLISTVVPAHLRRREPPRLRGRATWRELPGGQAELVVTTREPDADVAVLRGWSPVPLDRLAVTPPSVGDVLRRLAASA